MLVGGGGLNIARTLGDFFFKIDHDDPSLNKPAQAISSQPEIREVHLNKDSGSFLLIGCDGVWEATDFMDFTSPRPARAGCGVLVEEFPLQ